MKTPSLLLLPLLLAAPPSFAQVHPHRCDQAWLANADKIASAGAVPADDKKYLKSEDFMGGTRQVIDFNSAPALCDATVWHYLAVVSPASDDYLLDPKTGQPVGGTKFQWRDEGVQAAWGLGLAQQAKILEAVDEMYSFVDARGDKALAASDAVADAAVKLGVVKRTDLPAAKVNGLSHAPYESAKAYTLDASDGKSAATPAELKAALQAILAQAPAPAVKKGAKPLPAPVEPVLGPGVLAFRKAVIDLADELAVRARRRDLAQKWGVDAKVARDYAAGALPVFTPLAAVKGADASPAVSDAVAMKDENYRAALQYVTDPAIKDPADSSAHPNSALSALDYGLRNLIALRAAAVDSAVAAARKSLNGRSVKETLAGLDREDQRIKDENGVEVDAAKGLSADVLARLQQTKEFSDLNALYDAQSKKDPKWLESEDGKAVSAQLQRMRDDAGATRGILTKAGTSLEYSVGGLKVRNDGVRVADLGDKNYRAAIADAVAQNIAAGDGTQALVAKLKAAIEAVKGNGGSGTAVTAPLTSDQQGAASKLPQQPAVTPKPEPTPWQALLAATPAKGFFSFLGRDKSSVERYYSKFNEQQADAAHDRMAQRTRTQHEADDAYQAVVQNSADGRERVAAAPMDPDDSDAVQKQKRAQALKDYDADVQRRALAAKQAAVDKATRENRYKADENIAGERTEQHKQLMAKIDAAYSDGIKTSVGGLHADYLKAGSKRRKAAEELSGYSGQFYRGDRVDRYFKESWPMDKNPAPEVEACKSKLGFKIDFAGDEFRVKDPTADNVDGVCGVRDGLVSLLKSYRGTNKADAPVAKQ